MSYTTDTKLVLSFNSSMLIESVSQNAMLVGGTDTKVDLLTGGGYLMKPNQFLYIPDVVMTASSSMTIGFWYYAKHEGRAISPLSAVEDMKKPILEIGKGTYDIFMVYELIQSIVNVYEVCTDGRKNKMVVVVRDVSSNTFTSTSLDYDPDKWYFVTIMIESGAVSIWMDGYPSTASSTGTLTTLDAAVAGLWINRASFTPNYDVLQNTGIIDNVFVLNSILATDMTTTDGPANIQRMINSGYEFALDTNYENIQEMDFAFGYDDPTAVKVTDICRDGSYYFATQTNGNLLQGSQLFWKSRRDYSNAKEQDVVKYYGEEPKVEKGYLTITDGTVRL